jgi:hypothetical protein
VSDEKLEREVRSQGWGLASLWAVVLITIILLIKCGAFNGVFK